ncbi:MAG: glycosyltransferase family 2 protein [Chloroflexota bacterium]|nr:glycosyltransferase family 2 protein [Chloroflexota bacterium]
MDDEKIGISVIIPTLNEEDHIEKCIDSLLNCRSFETSGFNVEFIIVDGMSTDRTVSIVKEKFGHLNLKILKNPNLYQSYAMNIGIENSNHINELSLIIRADAHSKYPQDYIFQCWQASFNTRGGNAGSVQKAVGTNFFTRIIADVMNSGYAMGGVSYRKIKYDPSNPTTQYIDSDTAYLGCWRTSDLIEVRGFNEEFQINEDYELNIRLRNNGRKVIVVSNLIVEYFVRSSLFGLIKQFFRYGLWKTKTLSLHPDSLKLRQLAPVLFVLFLLSLVIGNLILSEPLLLFLNVSSSLIGVLWLVMILLIWKNSSNLFSIFFIPFIVLSMHISWGLGFLFGLSRWMRGGWNKS